MITDEPITVENPTTQIPISGAVLGENQPKITFDTKVVSREMQERGDGRFEFWFTNTGQLPLIISQVKSSCGCLVPSFTHEPVEPGERGFVMGQYDTRRTGSFTKTMTVLTNAYCKGIVLRIKGDVEPLSRERTIEKGESVIEK